MKPKKIIALNMTVNLSLDTEGSTTYCIESTIGKREGKGQENLTKCLQQLRQKFAEYIRSYQNGLKGFFGTQKNISFRAELIKDNAHPTAYTVEHVSRSDFLHTFDESSTTIINDALVMEKNAVSSRSPFCNRRTTLGREW